MVDNTNEVTIHADYFAELYAKANEKYDSEDAKSKKIAELKDELQGSRNCYYECRDELLEVAKERDKLKAKLDCADVDRETYKDRAEAAERCIEEMWSKMQTFDIPDRQRLIELESIIRAYREKKDAAR